MVQSPCGSGKTHHVINDILKPVKGEGVLVLYPYRLARAEFREAENEHGFDINHRYLTDLIINTVNCVRGEKAFYQEEEFYTTFIRMLKNYLCMMSINTIILDEADMSVLQSEMQYSLGFIPQENKSSLIGINAVSILYGAMAVFSKFNCIGFSANPLIFPPELAKSIVYTQAYVNQIVTTLKPNTRIKKIVFYETGGFAGSTRSAINYSILDKYIRKPSTLIFKSRFNKPMFKRLMKNDECLTVVRQENMPVTIHKNTGAVIPMNHDGDNLKCVGKKDDSDLLRDRMFNDFKCVAVNMSSTRAASLTDEYPDATVVVFSDTFTASTSQVVARFRNSNITVVWVGVNSKILDYTEAIDPFFKETINGTEIEVVKAAPLSHIGSTKGKSNEKSLTKTANLQFWVDSRDTTIKSIARQYREYKKDVPDGYGLSVFIRMYKELIA